MQNVYNLKTTELRDIIKTRKITKLYALDRNLI